MDFLRVFVLIMAGFGVVYCQHYDEEQEMLHFKESANWNYQTTKCNLLKNVESGETYYFDSFPPRPKPKLAAPVYDFPRRQPHQHYPQAHPYHVPFLQHLPVNLHSSSRKCTWKFKTDDNCELTISIWNYERGDIKCHKQHLILGDEKAETKICGFAKPPKQLTSSGKEIWMKHFQRNRHGVTTMNSYIHGCVSCIERYGLPPRSYETPDLENTYHSQNKHGTDNDGYGYEYGATYYTTQTIATAQDQSPPIIYITSTTLIPSTEIAVDSTTALPPIHDIPKPPPTADVPTTTEPTGRPTTEIPTTTGRQTTEIPTTTGRHTTEIPTTTGRHTTEIPTTTGRHTTEIPTTGRQTTEIPTTTGRHTTEIPTTGRQTTEIPTTNGRHTIEIPTTTGSGQSDTTCRTTEMSHSMTTLSVSTMQTTSFTMVDAENASTTLLPTTAILTTLKPSTELATSVTPIITAPTKSTYPMVPYRYPQRQYYPIVTNQRRYGVQTINMTDIKYIPHKTDSTRINGYDNYPKERPYQDNQHQKPASEINPNPDLFESEEDDASLYNYPKKTSDYGSGKYYPTKESGGHNISYSKKYSTASPYKIKVAQKPDFDKNPDPDLFESEEDATY